MGNRDILNKFYKQFNRSPSYREFILIGGKCKKEIYQNLLKAIGLPKSKKQKTIKFVDNLGNVAFIGTTEKIADEFNTTRNYIRKCASNNYTFRSKYIVKYKDIKEFEI